MRPALLLAPALALVACGPVTPTPDAGMNLCTGAPRTPPTLVENASFECEGGWSQVYGTLALVEGGRSGRAAQVTVNQAGGRFAAAKPFAENVGTKTYCVTAWLKGTAPFMRMRVLRDFNGSVQELAFSEQIFSDWRRIPTLKVTGDNAPKLTLVFEVQTNRTDGQNAMPGQTMLIDDVDVWESSVNCTESR